MDIAILAIGRAKAGRGKTGKAPEAELCARYLTRAQGLARAAGCRSVSMDDRPESRHADTGRRRDEEAAHLLAFSEGGVRVALDETGRDLASREWADLLARHRDDGAVRLSFLLGGPDGHGDALLSEADATIRLGRATWPHLLARALVAEQVYRALTMLTGHPYHRA